MTQASTRRRPSPHPLDTQIESSEQGEPSGERKHVGVLIVGSGFAGLGAAIRLRQAGRDDFLVIERGNDVGGTWRDNTYPGAACDVPSHLYQYSFEMNPNWSRSFSPQPEIQRYLHDTATKYDVRSKHLFNTDVTLARWDEAGEQWLVDTTNGLFSATLLVSAVGALAEPKLPDIEGIENFRGEIFHSARWNHGAELAGKRVALIGTGASAIQIGPELAKQVSHLDVFQRTAPWVVPRGDRPYGKLERLAFKHVPGVQRLAREAIYWGREMLVLGFAYRPKILGVAQKLATKNINRGISDPLLRQAVTPNWQIGCKRILISNTWYPMLASANVELVTDGIADIRENAVVTADGTVREVDAIVVATGFHVTDSPTYQRIVGVGGRRLADVWHEQGQQAYKGAAVHGFPNLLFVIGPNTGLGHSSMVYMAESHLNYLVSAVEQMDSYGLATFDVREDRQRAYNSALQRRMKSTIWSTGGCASWYMDEHGNNTTLWPNFTFVFRAKTRTFDRDAYRTTAVADRAERTGAARLPAPAAPNRTTEGAA